MVDSIGITQLVVASAPVLSTPSSQNVSPIALPTPAPVQPAVTDQVDISAEAAAQQPVQPKVIYADSEVLGTTSFSLYKGSDGKFVTRIVDEKTGKVTYIPKETPTLDITA